MRKILLKLPAVILLQHGQIHLVCKIVISCLKEVTGVDAYMSQYKDKIKGLLRVFVQRFQISGGLDSFLLAIDSQGF